MNYPGIPTTYRGVQMRSRLEATWAAFFDLLEWRWEYEPFDLEGYIPDFVLDFHKPLLIEVKPFGSAVEAQESQSKICRSGWTGESVVVGHALMAGYHGKRARLGWMIEDEPGFLGHSDAALTYCLGCHGATIISEGGWWGCRRCGAYDGNAFVAELEGIERRWAEAKNTSQWRPNDAA